MAYPDFVHMDGFDKYGPVGNDLQQALNASLWADEWNFIGAGTYCKVDAPLSGPTPGHGCIHLKATNSGNVPASLDRVVPGNYARVVGGFTAKMPDATSICGIQFKDGTTIQACLVLNNTTGKIEIRRGSLTGTLIAQSTETYSAGTTHVIEYDLTFHGTLGKAKVWLDGILTSINLTGQNTITTANAYVNRYGPATNNANNHEIYVDHMYHWFYLASGGTETPCLDNPIIETSPASGDDAVAWTINGHAFATPLYYWGQGQLTVTPGAGTIYLRKVTVDQNGSITNLIIPKPNTSSASAKQKAVIYADSAGAPGALLATGTEVVGTTSGTALVLPVALAAQVAGTVLWVGMISDTAINYGCNDEAGSSYDKANTYASGPPSPAGAGFTTNILNINMIVTMTGVTAHYAQANASPSLGDYSYNYSGTLNQQDMFTFPALSSAPLAIHAVAVKGRIARSDTGVRAAKFIAKSGGASSYGSSGDISPPSSYGMEGSNYMVDPNTGIAWSAGALAAAKFGIEVTL